MPRRDPRPWPAGCARLQLVAASRNGLTIQQVADNIGVHRTIAYRLLSTLAQPTGWSPRATTADTARRRAWPCSARRSTTTSAQLSLPTLRELADDLGTTVSLLVAEGDQQVAIAVIVPTHVSYQLSFHEGSRYPLDRGAAGIALLASMPPQPGERELVTKAREQGWVITHGEIEPSTYGLAVPVQRPPTVAAHLHQPDLAPRGRRAARQGRGRRGGRTSFEDSQLSTPLNCGNA